MSAVEIHYPPDVIRQDGSGHVPMDLFDYHCEQVLELTRVFVQLAAMAECHNQAARAREVEANIASAMSNRSFAPPSRRRSPPRSRPDMVPQADGGSTVISARALQARLEDTRYWLQQVESEGQETLRTLESLSDTFKEWHKTDSLEFEKLRQATRAHECRFREAADNVVCVEDELRKDFRSRLEALGADLESTTGGLRSTASSHGEQLRAVEEAVFATEKAGEQREAHAQHRAAEQRRYTDTCNARLQEEQRLVSRRISDVEATMRAIEVEVMEMRGSRGAWLRGAQPPSPARKGAGALPVIS